MSNACGVDRTNLLLFFFQSRSGHARCGRDWSSAVCSPDLGGGPRRDVELDEVSRRAERLHERDIVAYGLARHAHDERHAVREVGEGGAEVLEPRVLEPVAVDEPWAGGGPDARQVGLRMAGTRLDGDG